jgi:hypothetical protein
MGGKIQDSLNLLPCHAEFFHKFIDGHVLEIIKHSRHRRPGSFKHPRAAPLPGDAFYGRALRPIGSRHVLVPITIAVRAAPFALPAGRGSVFVRFYTLSILCRARAMVLVAGRWKAPGAFF